MSTFGDVLVVVTGVDIAIAVVDDVIAAVDIAATAADAVDVMVVV